MANKVNITLAITLLTLASVMASSQSGNQTNILYVPLTTHNFNQQNTDVSALNNLECGVCEYLVSDIDNLLESNDTVTEIEHIVENVCQDLGSHLSQYCVQFVEQYTPIIVQLLAQDLSPAVVCEKIGLCKTGITHDHIDGVYHIPVYM
jgi:hypothetical protein